MSLQLTSLIQCETESRLNSYINVVVHISTEH